jgi:hypothetical protein
MGACQSPSGPAADQRTILFTNASTVGYFGGVVDSAVPARLDVEFHLAAGTQRCVRFPLAQLQGDSALNVSSVYDGANFVHAATIHVGGIANWTWNGSTTEIATAPC